MHQTLGITKVDTSLVDGMVAPGIPLSVTRQEDAHISMTGRPSSASQTQGVFDATGTIMENSAQYFPHVNAKTPAIEEENGTCFSGHTQCFLMRVDNGSMIEEPETEMEGFIMREHDIDVIREPVAEVNSSVKGSRDDRRDSQPIMASNQGVEVIANDRYALQKRRVQWNDNFGKELVQVHEYEASDTGDSEEEDDDADAHACTCTIQ